MIHGPYNINLTSQRYTVYAHTHRVNTMQISLRIKSYRLLGRTEEIFSFCILAYEKRRQYRRMIETGQVLIMHFTLVSY